MSESARAEVERYRKQLGPYVYAVEKTRMPMIFTDARDDANSIVYANDSFLALTGFARDAILGQPLQLLFAQANPTDISSSLQASLAAGLSGQWEMHCRRARGNEFMASVYLTPVWDQEGFTRQNFLCFGVQRPLISQRNHLQELYKHVPGFIAIFEGPEHSVSFANLACERIFGAGLLEGRNVAEILPEVSSQALVEILDQVFQTGQPFEAHGMQIDLYDPALQRPTTRHLDFIAQPVRDLGSVIVGIFCAGHDLTSERDAAESLAMLQSELIQISRTNTIGIMGTTIAHEMNQPLSAIVNYTSGALRLVEGEGAKAELLAGALKEIDAAARRASEIIRSLRNMSRRGNTNRTSFDLRAAIEESSRLVLSAMPSSVDIGIEMPDDINILADRIQIQQVFINLMRNACEAVVAAHNREITVSAEIRGDDVIMCVADHGPGVSLEAAQALFTSTESVKDLGMGLGLSISRTIVEAHSGRIWLERTSAAGSQFCFSIPLREVRQVEPLITPG